MEGAGFPGAGSSSGAGLGGLEAEHDGERHAVAAFRAQSRRRMGLALGLGALALVGLAVGLEHRSRVAALWRGEMALDGSARYAPSHAADAAVLAAADMERAHAALWPAWMIARSPRSGVSEARRADRSSRAFAELRYVLAHDPNLADLADRFEVALRDPLANVHEIDYLLFAYNDYLDRHDVPYRLEAEMHLRERGEEPLFTTRSYRVSEDLRAPEGERLRLLTRLDMTNIVEGFLGETRRANDGALVLLDRVLDFSVHHVWPAMHPALDERLPTNERRLARAVRREAARTLAPDLLSVLNETAVDQMALIEVRASIHGRRDCGNRFRVWGLPWNGLTPPDRQSLVDAFTRSRGRDCPEVTVDEAARMIGASERLGTLPDVEDAVEELGTWVARAVAVHELRHVADAAPGALDCPGCPDGMEEDARAELSAYLAAFGTDGVAYLSLLQACSMDPVAGVGPHEQALAVAFAHLLPGGCLAPPPADLPARARALERELFGDRRLVRVPDGFPVRAPLLPGRDEPRRLARH